jgi:putative nucleotidyltransferase with HDIG domain
MPDALIGRYGPDEFIVAAEVPAGQDLEDRLEDFRRSLAEESLEFEGSEQLPISVSVGIAGYPSDAGSVTGLLSVAAAMLAEAGTSGGDSIRRATGPVTRRAGGYDVLKGLVLAIDGKDRYTKRHSEDVAHYGLLIAQQLGLPPDELATVRTAGLLHDVGKIGIPDDILRKPGRLTAEEKSIIQDHVRLGDLIVRDLPDLDRVRAGVRYHHERIDGKGYLDHLEADEIPLMGRILAVADTFSAMVTTRPYRKALPLDEALQRLGDAAGTQLDERLVRAFLAAMDAAEDDVRLAAPRGLALLRANVA